MRECGLCTQRPLCGKCSRINVKILLSVGIRDVRTLNIPFQDAVWVDNEWIMKVGMDVRVDSYWQVIVYVMGMRIDPIHHGYSLFPEEQELPDGIRIPYTDGVTLIGFFKWYEVHDDDIARMRKYFRHNVDILARPAYMMQKFSIGIVQVVLSPTFFQSLQHYGISIPRCGSLSLL